MNLKESLGLSLELTGLIIASYFVHPRVAKYLNLEDSLALSLLIFSAIIFWSLHAYFFFVAREK